MEITLPYPRQPNYNRINLVLALLVVATLGSYVAFRLYSEFNDCFSRNGIKEIYVTVGNQFIRTCELPDGKIVAQRVKQTITGWDIDKVYLAENVEDIPHLLLRIYPNGETFSYVVKQLVTFFP